MIGAQPADFADELGRALDQLQEARKAARRLEHDYRSAPERTAIALVTRDGCAARHWHDLCGCLAAAEETLSDVVSDLDGVLDLDSEQDPEGEPAPEAELAESETIPDVPVETTTVVHLEAARARIGKQRRGNGAAPSVASIPPVRDRQSSCNQETSNHGTPSRLD